MDARPPETGILTGLVSRLGTCTLPLAPRNGKIAAAHGAPAPSSDRAPHPAATRRPDAARARDDARRMALGARVRMAGPVVEPARGVGRRRRGPDGDRPVEPLARLRSRRGDGAVRRRGRLVGGTRGPLGRGVKGAIPLHAVFESHDLRVLPGSPLRTRLALAVSARPVGSRSASETNLLTNPGKH